MDQMKRMPPTIITTGEFDHLRRDALAIIPKLETAGRLLDVLDVPATRHSYESEVEAAHSLFAEVETIKIWNHFVLDQVEAPRPAVSKNILSNKYKHEGIVDEDVKEDYDTFAS